MDASIIWENPGLTLLGVLAGIFLILLIPVIGAFRRSRAERRDAPLRSREPSLFGDRYYDHRGYDDRDYDNRDRSGRQDYGSYFARYSEEPSAERWRGQNDGDDDVPAGRFGSGARRRKKPARTSAPGRGIWFVIGICVGAGGLALWWSLPPVNSLPTLLALFEPDPPSAVVEAPTAPATPTAPADTKGQDQVAAPVAIGDGGDASVGDMVESFVTNLEAQLPMAVGPGITMVNVDSEGAVVALGFTIAQTVSDEDMPKLQEELETRFGSSVCATAPDPTNIHGLNEQGVSFIITYVDLLGKKVAGMTVEPNFCSGNG
jgi:hypothetical protein